MNPPTYLDQREHNAHDGLAASSPRYDPFLEELKQLHEVLIVPTEEHRTSQAEPRSQIHELHVAHLAPDPIQLVLGVHVVRQLSAKQISSMKIFHKLCQKSNNLRKEISLNTFNFILEGFPAPTREDCVDERRLRRTRNRAHYLRVLRLGDLERFTESKLMLESAARRASIIPQDFPFRRLDYNFLERIVRVLGKPSTSELQMLSRWIGYPLPALFHYFQFRSLERRTFMKREMVKQFSLSVPDVGFQTLGDPSKSLRLSRKLYLASKAQRKAALKAKIANKVAAFIKDGTPKPHDPGLLACKALNLLATLLNQLPYCDCANRVL